MLTTSRERVAEMVRRMSFAPLHFRKYKYTPEMLVAVLRHAAPGATDAEVIEAMFIQCAHMQEVRYAELYGARKVKPQHEPEVMQPRQHAGFGSRRS
jgi:hypothetical protein